MLTAFKEDLKPGLVHFFCCNFMWRVLQKQAPRYSNQLSNPKVIMYYNYPVPN